MIGVDIKEQEQETDHEELEAALHEEEEDIFLSAQEDEDDEEDEDILLSPQEEKETVPVEVDDEGDILFTKITQSLNHADDGYDEDDSVPIAVLFNNDNSNSSKKKPVEDTIEVNVFPAPRLICGTVDYTVVLVRWSCRGEIPVRRVRIVSANAGDSRAIFAPLLSPAQAAAILLPL